MTDKDLLDQYLEGGSELSELYGMTKDTPDTERIDDAVLSAAKRELNTQPVVARRHKVFTWFVPLSAAATVVLTATLYISNQEVIESTDLPATPSVLQNADQAPKDQAIQRKEQQSLLEQRSMQPAAETTEQGMMLKKSKSMISNDSVAAPAAAPETIEQEAHSSRYQSFSDSPSKLATDQTEPKAKQEAQRARSLTITPEALIQQIRLLIETDDLDKARMELTRLVEVFPEYPIPEDLQRLAKALTAPDSAGQNDN